MERDPPCAVVVPSHVRPHSDSHCDAEASDEGLSVSPAQLWLRPSPAHVRSVLPEITMRDANA